MGRIKRAWAELRVCPARRPAARGRAGTRRKHWSVTVKMHVDLCCAFTGFFFLICTFSSLPTPRWFRHDGNHAIIRKPQLTTGRHTLNLRAARFYAKSTKLKPRPPHPRPALLMNTEIATCLRKSTRKCFSGPMKHTNVQCVYPPTKT